MAQSEGIRQAASGVATVIRPMPVNLSKIIGVSFFMFFIFDNYSPGLGMRPFDFVGLILLLGVVVVGMCCAGLKWDLSLGTILFSVSVGIVLLFSLTVRPDQWRAHLGIVLGLVVFICYRSFGRTGGMSITWLNAILAISVGALLVQAFYYVISGNILDLVLFAEGDLRVWYGGTIFRPPGLFMEPNTYSIATAMLVLLRREVMFKPFDALSYAAIGSMFVSMSLWGGIVGLALILYDLFSRNIGLALVFILVLITGSALFAFNFGGESSPDNPFRVTLIQRVETLVSGVTSRAEADTDIESSFRDRYSALAKLVDQDDFDYRMFIGNGVSTRDFQEYGGANALSFLGYSFGLVGIALVVLAIAALAKGGMGKPLAVLISISSYPLFTYFFWWAWLGLLMSVPTPTRRVGHFPTFMRGRMRAVSGTRGAQWASEL